MPTPTMFATTTSATITGTASRPLGAHASTASARCTAPAARRVPVTGS
ncbi:hypothetical protein [Blastococcus sp. TF02A-26]|nr:hypothetical protein [Blastococcus sp. TF02A-26]